MHLLRPSFAQDPTRFGRANVRIGSDPVPLHSDLASDVKLFAATFVAGFLFVSILIG